MKTFLLLDLIIREMMLRGGSCKSRDNSFKHCIWSNFFRFMTDLDPPTIEALAVTVPSLQAPAIRNLFYKNLTGKPAIGASISVSSIRYVSISKLTLIPMLQTEDLPVFTLEFHIPYFIPKRSKHSITDFRKTADGQPLRRSLELPVPLRPMITSTPAAGQVWLCENQTSIVVTGIDHWVWTAYGIVDTYFGSKESLKHYDEQSDQSGQVDPLSKGQLHAHPLTLIWTPREYFLAIVAIRMNEALRAWRETISVVEDSVKQYVYTEEFPILFTCWWDSAREENFQILAVICQNDGCLERFS